MSFVLFLAAAVVPAGTEFRCTPVAVWDGDGPIWCAEGQRIRLAGIAARESDGTCNTNQPCPAASAAEATSGLVALIGRPTGKSPNVHTLVEGPAMRCISEGSAGGSRTVAWCQSPKGGALSCAMVQSGMALRWDRYWRNYRCA